MIKMNHSYNVEHKKINRIFSFLFRGSSKVKKEEKKSESANHKEKWTRNSLTIASNGMKRNIGHDEQTNEDRCITLVNQIHDPIHSHALAWLRLRWTWCVGVDKWLPFGDDGDIDPRRVEPSLEFWRGWTGTFGLINVLRSIRKAREGRSPLTNGIK